MLHDIKGLNVYIPLHISRAQIFLLILRARIHTFLAISRADTFLLLRAQIFLWISRSHVPVVFFALHPTQTQNLDIKGPNIYIPLHKKGSNTPLDIKVLCTAVDIKVLCTAVDTSGLKYSYFC